MKANRMTAFAIAALGLAVAVAGPLLPGGERLTRHDPPHIGHVTDLERADDGSVLAGTQDGALWRFSGSAWSQVRVDLGGHPVTSLGADLTGDPARGPIGTAGGLVNAPSGLPPLKMRISDETPTRNGLVVATGEGVRIQRDGQWDAAITDVNVYRLERHAAGGTEYVHAGSVGAGVYTASVDDLTSWAPNSRGLPDGANVFTFAVSERDRLLAGTDQGIFWQAAPDQPWQSLKTGLERSRILSMYLAPGVNGAAQRLWIGSDNGLYRVDLTEQESGIEAAAYAELIEATPEEVPFGISWIVPNDDGVMFSAGGVFRYGPEAFQGWYWISLFGVILLLLGGWLLPAREQTPPPAGATI